jgi:hypothetical protein
VGSVGGGAWQRATHLHVSVLALRLCIACKKREAPPNALQCLQCQQGHRDAAVERVRAAAARATASAAAPQASGLEKDAAAKSAAFLRLIGFAVENTSQARASRISEGFPDRYVRCPVRGVRFFLEDKRLEWGAPRKDGSRPVRRTRPSRVQAAWIAVEEAAGGCVIVAACVSDLLAALPRAGVHLTEREKQIAKRFTQGDLPGEDWRTPIPHADALRILREEREKLRAAAKSKH